MTGQPVAVLGGGNGGHMMAVDLTSRGYPVHFYEHPRFEETFRVGPFYFTRSPQYQNWDPAIHIEYDNRR